jgi:mannose-6-phosphate isomerase-like protein (cupin superfamily)
MRRAWLRIERCFSRRHLRAKARHHLLQHMIAPDAEPVAGNLHIGVAVAEMPGEPHQFERRARRDLGERLGLTRDQHNPPVVEHDAVAVAQRHRLVEIEQEFGAALAREPDAAAMPVGGIEHDTVGSGRGIPEARAANGPAALHGRRFSAHNDARSGREIIMSKPTTLKGKYSAAGEGNIYARANVATCKITAGDTDGTFEISDEQCKPGFESRLHMHTKSFQVCYVVDGSGEFQLGDEVFHARKGACVNIPPGVPHKVGSKEGMRMLMVYSPPGLEGMMKAMKALSPEQLADGALTSRLLAEHDTVVLGESAGSKGYGSVLG